MSTVNAVGHCLQITERRPEIALCGITTISFRSGIRTLPAGWLIAGSAGPSIQPVARSSLLHGASVMRPTLCCATLLSFAASGVVSGDGASYSPPPAPPPKIGQTPATGFLSWQHYRCNRNCKTDPDNCLSEKMIKRTADLMVSENYAAAGYRYVNIDDCWQAPNRNATGHVVADPDNFPSGIKALADYVHSKGLLLGIYTALGNGTCAMGGTSGLPRGTGKNLGLGCDAGSLPGCAVAERDINDFVSWGIDALKVDGCFEFDSDAMNRSYARVGKFAASNLSLLEVFGALSFMATPAYPE